MFLDSLQTCLSWETKNHCWKKFWFPCTFSSVSRQTAWAVFQENCINQRWMCNETWYKSVIVLVCLFGFLFCWVWFVLFCFVLFVNQINSCPEHIALIIENRWKVWSRNKRGVRSLQSVHKSLEAFPAKLWLFQWF